MDNTDICKALFDAFTTGDEDRVRSLCAPEIKAWQNNNPPMDLDTLLGFSHAVLEVVKDFRYEEVRRSATATGFVEEHRVRGTLPDYSKLDLAVCVVADIRDGKIYSLREYLDTSAATELRAALS
ncbi:MAG: ketosteroid isomerase-like protein [Glaciecola sp.]|jgi:ketosteroid isomerase-like protein|uniref:nuclear transport factor 2 family protein n=1 Tax=Congregibacter sp. TaxID=2744308 RepID=UPI0039E21E5A